MKLSCPQCSQAVPAENINIQDLVAVCPACNSLFSFTAPDAAPEPKLKRRKVHQPAHLQLDEGKKLRLAYRTNFRLDRNENFISSAVTSGAVTFVSLLFWVLYFENEMPLMMPLLASLFILPMYYWLGLIAFNKTHIEMDELSIKTSRQPLPNFGQKHEISLSDVESISTEETSASRQNEYDTPRYHVWANRADGTRRVIASDLIDEYAYFIAQKLDGFLQHSSQDPATARLSDALPPELDEEMLFAAESDPHEAQSRR